MDILDFKDLEDWRLKSECLPFEDSLGNLCITVESEYESFGGEKDARLDEARDYGIDRLIRFYGKTYVSEGVSLVAPVALEITKSQASIAPATPTKLYDAASTPDYFISQRSCVRMKVLVKIPKDTFDNYTANSAACDINKPAEGYLSAFISVENYERDIDYITTSMEDFLPKMAKADKYMTNINIVKEIKRLKQVKSVIRRYLNLNSVTATAIKEEECEVDKQSQMEIGFGYDYKPAFALIDGSKHTIGYDCFLEASKLNHPTTANYLLQLGNMSSALTNQLSLDFDIFQFLVQYTYPTPVVEAKKNSLDGIEKYDANGNLFSFANLAKLITLDLDKKSCKLDGEKERERNAVFSDATKANIASTVRQSKEFVGNIIFSESEGWQDLKETGRTASYYSSDSSTSYFRGQRSVDKIYNDVINKIDFNCVLEESLKCSLEAAITRLGEEAFNDPDLSEFFNADGVIELFGLCEPDNCKNQLQLKVGLPAFQGINIPANFPTVDYLAKTMDAALKKLYDVLIDAIVSFINGIFELMCKAVSATEFAAIGSMFGDGFKSWLSKTIGVDVSLLTDGKAWADAALSAGGTGFMGEIGNLSAKVAGSWDALVQDTGISLNLPNPNTGMVEEVLISLDLIYQTMSGVQKATEDLEVILTSGELKSLYKGAAPDDVLDLAYGCLHRGNPDLFQSREDVSDLFSSLGEMVNGNFLEESATTPITVTNACGLDDGTNQDILARSNLTSKDPLLSDSEIEELLSKEKNRLIEKVKKLHKLLKAFQDGTLFPSFPSLFGSDDSLIPEAPPVISAAMATVSEGLYSSTINNFNVSMLQYAPLWKTTVEFSTGSANPTFAELSSKLMIYDTSAALYRKLNVDDNMTNLGYTINADADDDTVESVQESTLRDLGVYSWNNGNFDAGAYTDDWWKNNSGADDAQFAQLIRDAGIRYVDLSEDDFALFGTWEGAMVIAAVVAIIALIVLAIIFSGGTASAVATVAVDVGGAETAGLMLLLEGTVATAEIAAVTAGTTALTLPIVGSISVAATSWILIGVGAVAALLLAGSLGLSWWLNEKNADLAFALQAFMQVEPTLTYTEFLEKIDCLYDGGEMTDSQYDELIPVANDLYDANKIASDQVQWALIKSVANHLEDIDDDDDSHEEIFDISDWLEVRAAPGIKTELILKSEVSGQWNPLKEDVFYTHAYVRETPASSKEINLERAPDFSEVITSFERRGVRSDASSAKEGYTKPSEMDFKMISIQDIYDSGTSLAEYDRIENKISNYRMENESSLLLGRKIAKPDLLETRYSSTIEAPDKSIMELFESQVTKDNDLQEYHLELLDIIEQSGLLTVSSDNVKTIYRDIWEDCMRAMAERVSNNRMYIDEYLNALDLEYPKQDIIGYKKISEGSIDLTSSIMNLESSSDDYCDTLTPLRRSGSITGLRLIIRTFTVERVLNSLQVFDTFNTDFMTSDMFKKAVFDDIKVEMNKYQNSFETTLDGKIFSDMKETASKYFEIQGLLGNEVPEINTDKEAILEIIKMEIDDINTKIASQLKLDTPYQSSTWDEFVFDVLLTEGTYASGVDPEDGAIRQFEHPSVLYPFYAETDTSDVPNEDGSYTYIAQLKYFDSLGLFGNAGIAVPVIRAECPGSMPIETKDGCLDVQTVADYSKVKQLLFDNEIYQNLISYVFPLKDAATLLSTYHLSAITDPAVFSATINGKHVTDLFAETKLSTLQTFLACIHGARETTYIDPFLEKLKT